LTKANYGKCDEDHPRTSIDLGHVDSFSEAVKEELKKLQGIFNT